jgi:hypothetical protein
MQWINVIQETWNRLDDDILVQIWNNDKGDPEPPCFGKYQERWTEKEVAR